MQTAVTSRVATDVCPDEPIELRELSERHGRRRRARRWLHRQGRHVAVVDSGCDASHPDLADHVAHNVKL